MTTRIHYWDNFKFILIVTVIASHMLGAVRMVSPHAMDVWNFFYLFHMPAFIMVSGYFLSNSYSSQSHTIRILYYLILYTISNVVLYAMDYILGFNRNITWFLESAGATWYLQSMIIWILLVPIIQNLKTPFAISLSILAGILIGLDPKAGHYASISRTIVFLPFFVIGMKFDLSNIQALRHNKRIKTLSYVILFLLFVIISLNRNLIDGNLFRGICSYEQLKYASLSKGITARLIWYILAFITTVALMLATPDRKTCLSHYGKNSLQIYLYHIPIYEYCVRSGLTMQIAQYGFIGKLSLIVFAIPLAFILGNKIISCPLNVSAP